MQTHILLIDDSVTVHKIVELTLDRQKFALTGAYSAEAGITEATALKPGIILVDNKFITNNNYVDDLVAASPKSDIILLVGSYEQYLLASVNDSIVSYVIKPLNAKTLNNSLESSVNRHRSANPTKISMAISADVDEDVLLMEPEAYYPTKFGNSNKSGFFATSALPTSMQHKQGLISDRAYKGLLVNTELEEINNIDQLEYPYKYAPNAPYEKKIVTEQSDDKAKTAVSLTDKDVADENRSHDDENLSLDALLSDTEIDNSVSNDEIKGSMDFEKEMPAEPLTAFSTATLMKHSPDEISDEQLTDTDKIASPEDKIAKQVAAQLAAQSVNDETHTETSALSREREDINTNDINIDNSYLDVEDSDEFVAVADSNRTHHTDVTSTVREDSKIDLPSYAASKRQEMFTLKDDGGAGRSKDLGGTLSGKKPSGEDELLDNLYTLLADPADGLAMDKEIDTILHTAEEFTVEIDENNSERIKRELEEREELFDLFDDMFKTSSENLGISADLTLDYSKTDLDYSTVDPEITNAIQSKDISSMTEYGENEQRQDNAMIGSGVDADNVQLLTKLVQDKYKVPPEYVRDNTSNSPIRNIVSSNNTDSDNSKNTVEHEHNTNMINTNFNKEKNIDSSSSFKKKGSLSAIANKHATTSEPAAESTTTGKGGSFKKIVNMMSAGNKSDLSPRGGWLAIDLSKEDIAEILERAIDKQELRSMVKDIVKDALEYTLQRLVPEIAEQAVREEIKLMRGGR